MHPSWFTQRLLGYYKHKAAKLEKEYNGLLEMVENVKSICDTSNELRSELNLRNEEVSKLQQLVGDLQVGHRVYKENFFSILFCPCSKSGPGLHEVLYVGQMVCFL